MPPCIQQFSMRFDSGSEAGMRIYCPERGYIYLRLTMMGINVAVNHKDSSCSHISCTSSEVETKERKKRKEKKE